MSCRQHLAGPFVALLLLVAGTVPAAFAQSAAAQFAADSRQLENDVTAAQKAWDEQRRLSRALTAAAQALEKALGAADSSANELRALEDRYAVALEAAVRQARLTSDRRHRVYDGMDRLAAAGRRVEQEKRAAYDVPVPGGLWRIELPQTNVVGLMRLTANGTLVSGDYRLSNGRSGSVRGTYTGGRLQVVRVDSQSGQDGTLTAEVDAAGGTLSGTWQRDQLATGEPAMGAWTGVRLGPGDEVPDLDGD
ncbi:MAG: hypothetical protein QG573_1922 [Acidobacteriota bacterium]|nr:hypothetical protein [Acidobacteriota bacterium]